MKNILKDDGDRMGILGDGARTSEVQDRRGYSSRDATIWVKYDFVDPMLC